MPNPMLNIKRDVREEELNISKNATISGTVNKSLILLTIVAFVAYYSWNLCLNGFADKAMLLTVISAIAGLILALITSFKPHVSNITAPVYALCEGVLVGTVSFSYGALYNGIVLNAICLTFICLFSMLFLYKTGLIKATSRFKQIIITSTIAVAIFYGVIFIASLFGVHTNIFGTNLGIGISIAICAIAAFNYIIDFDLIERTINENYPDYFEWYNGFALLVTTIWLYFELLRLLAQLNSKR